VKITTKAITLCLPRIRWRDPPGAQWRRPPHPRCVDPTRRKLRAGRRSQGIGHASGQGGRLGEGDRGDQYPGEAEEDQRQAAEKVNEARMRHSEDRREAAAAE
jgi:hypothetical protein